MMTVSTLVLLALGAFAVIGVTTAVVVVLIVANKQTHRKH